jgi:hypothetical protein
VSGLAKVFSMHKSCSLAQVKPNAKDDRFKFDERLMENCKFIVLFSLDIDFKLCKVIL